MKSLYLLLITASFVLLSACQAFEPKANDYNNLEITVIDQWAVQGPSPISYNARKGTTSNPGGEFLFYTRFEKGLKYTWTTTKGKVQGSAEDQQRSRVRIKFMPEEIGVLTVTVKAPGYKAGSKEVILDAQLPSRALDKQERSSN